MEITLSMKLETPAENLGEILKLAHHIEYLVPPETQEDMGITVISDVSIGDAEYACMESDPCYCECCDGFGETDGRVIGADVSCIHRVYGRFNEYAKENPCMSKDEIIEMLWQEMRDVPMDENSNGELILHIPWRGFPKGFTQDDWFHWVDENHSKGVGWVSENVF